MALVTTILTVTAMLGGVAVILWLSTVLEARHLGPMADHGEEPLSKVLDAVDRVGVEEGLGRGGTQTAV